MRWLAVDPGTHRVGIAACDREERIAVPMEIVPERVALPAIRTIVKREEIDGIVIGLPLLLDGNEGSAARMARRLGSRIEKALKLPIVYEDERLTTVAAMRDQDNREPSDDIAAALMLQQFIDRRNKGRDVQT